MKEKKLLRNISLTIFCILVLINLLTFIIGFEFSKNIWSILIITLVFALIETTIMLVLITYYNDTFKVVDKNIGQMIRFENLNHPLIKRLSNEAPGTYNHSLNVAELATKAAQSINLDANYLRLGGYFHDIGKLKNPKTFNENQKDDSRISEIELPKVSRGIIDHVVYGQKLAREYNLPDEVIEYIGQHHGSSEIFSLRKRLEAAGLNAQYPGPKPLSKEAAILMLADSIEARVRSMKTVTDESVKKAVENEFTKKINDKQLDLSGLGRSEIAKIQENFTKTILSIYHQRKIKSK